jgi:glycosyltransferase involved in cell wall biosynthesis
MSHHPEVSVIVPAFNEEKNILQFIEEAAAVLPTVARTFEVIIIDDCSSDGTNKIITSALSTYPWLKLVRNDVNIGCHPSTLVGFAVAQFDCIVFLPSDRQIPVSEVDTFLSARHNVDEVVYSWRRHRRDPLLRRVVSRCYNSVVRVLTGTRLHDIDSASMLTKGAVAKIIPTIEARSAYITVEILLAARERGISVREVEIQHRPRVAGIARGLNFRDTFSSAISLIKLVLHVRCREKQVSKRIYG